MTPHDRQAEITLTVNGRDAHARGRAPQAARRRAPRGPRPDRHAHRLRARRLRHVHRAARRREHPLLHHLRRAGRRRASPHGRGPRPRARPAPAAGRVLGQAGPAVRLLHPGDADACLRDPRAQPGPDARAGARGIASNLCRCTGYQFIVEAVVAAAPRMRGENAGIPRHRRRRRHDRRSSAPPRRCAPRTRPARGSASHPPRRGPEVPARARRLHRRPRPCPACCTPPCCAARTRTPGSCPSTPTAARPLAGRARGDHRRAGRRALRPAARLRTRPAKHTWRCLAADKVRYVGEGVAVVVADSRYLAEDALALIDVEYEPLPAVVDPERALQAGAPLVHEALGSNCAYERTFDFGDVDRDFAEADVVVRDRLRWHRSGGQPLETVGAIADYDHATGQLTVHTNSLCFTSYLFMVAGTLKIPANKLDIRPVPAGGSFGSKLFATKPAVIAGMCSRAVGRPVVYLEDRVDNISNCDHHGSRPRLRRRARDDARRHDARHQDRHRRRLRRLHPVRRRPPRQRAGPGRRALHDRQRAVPGAGGADQQEPAGRLPGLRLRGQQLDARADGRQGRARARPGPGARSGGRTSSAGVPATSSRPATSTTPATTTPCSTRRSSWRTTTTGGPSRPSAREEGRYIGIGADHRPGAQRVLGHRVLVLVRRARRAGDLDAGER